jgi:hypothetical protein
MNAFSATKKCRLALTLLAALAVLLSCHDAVSNGTSSLSSDANLKSLVLTAIGPTENYGLSLDTAFISSTTSYSATAPYPTTMLTVTAIANDDGASVSGTGSSTFAGTSDSHPVSLVVTAADGVTKKTYTVGVTRQAANSIADLSSLTVSSGELVPSFSPATTSYTVYLDYPKTGVTLTAIPSATADGATVLGDGYQSIDVGTNPCQVIVTAQDGVSKKGYSVTIYRGAESSTSLSTNAYLKDLVPGPGTISLSPAFAYDTYEYSLTLPYGTESLVYDATTADSGATVQYPSALSIVPGTTTTQVITVTAAAGNTLDYTVNATCASAAASHDTTLSDIVLHGIDLYENESVISFSGGGGSYSATVDYKFIKAYLSFVPPSGATWSDEGSDLAVGSSNAYTVTITAADGTTKATYTFAITRSAASSTASIDAAFNNITLSGASMTVAGTGIASVESIKGRVVGPDCPVFTADVSGGAWTAVVDVSSTTNGPKILLVYPVDQSGGVAGTISYIPVTVSGSSQGPGGTLSGTFGFADGDPTSGTVIVSASPVVASGSSYTLDPPIAMLITTLSGSSSTGAFTLTGLLSGEYVVEAVYYEGDDYCVVPERYGASARVQYTGDLTLGQPVTLF